MKRKYEIRVKKKHFYASSIASWRVSEDLETLIKDMKREGYSFAVVMVPLPIEADYEITSYMPNVEGCVLLAEYIMREW